MNQLAARSKHTMVMNIVHILMDCKPWWMVQQFVLNRIFEEWPLPRFSMQGARSWVRVRVPMTLALKIAYLTGKMAKVLRHFREKLKQEPAGIAFWYLKMSFCYLQSWWFSENKGKASKYDLYLMINTIFSSKKYFSDVLNNNIFETLLAVCILFFIIQHPNIQ